MSGRGVRVLENTVSFVADRSTNGTDEDLLAQLLDEYLRSLETGNPISLSSLTEKYPHLANELEKFGKSIDALHHATQHLSSGDSLATGEPSLPSKQLGDFKLGREVGRGGMGIVYEAQQISLNRKVALKVLPLAAVWDKKQVARFQNEARAAAQLQHPHIVPVFAVGEENGVHFYAMQFIDGDSLDVSLSEERQRLKDTRRGDNKTTARDGIAPLAKPETARLSQPPSSDESKATPTPAHSSLHKSRGPDFYRGVARLGIEAADALQHAHDCGIIHRDVKPSNLLRDQQGKTWVADFGLARIQKNPNVTMTGDVVGTLRYMSPEQALGRQAEVDSRSDVYGLGATLYELLAKQPPFPADDREELIYDITNRDPLPLRAINPAVPRDLETIVLHALAKSREDRYETARALADDLKRFLNGQPPLARRPNLLDHAQKWLFRNRAVATVAVAALALLTIVFAGGLILLAQETAAKNAALARSEQNLKQAREVVDRFGMQFSELLRAIPGAERLRQELLVETVSYYDELAQQAADDLSLRDQVADAHLKVASVTAAIGANQEAINAYRKGQHLLEEQLLTAADSTEIRQRLGIIHNNLALVFSDANRLEEAVQECNAAIDIYKGLLANQSGNLEWAAQTAEIQGNYSTILSRLGKTAEAEQAAKQAIGTLTGLYGESPAEPAAAHRLALLLNNLSILQRKDKLQDAEQTAEQAVALLQAISSGEAVPIEHLADLALAQANLAAIQAQDANTSAAAENLQTAIGLQQAVASKAPAVARYRLNLINSLNSLALLKSSEGDIAAAEQVFERASVIYSRLVTDYPNEIAYTSGWAALLNNVGLVLAQADQHEKAAKIYQNAEFIQERVVATFPQSLPVRQTLSRIYFNHRQSLQALGHWEEAMTTTSKRRTLWQGNGEQMTRVAMEFLAMSAVAPDKNQNLLKTAVVETLHEALDAGYLPSEGLEQSEQFAAVLDWPESQTLKDRWTP